jgi:CheY-like chemotaxis protein
MVRAVKSVAESVDVGGDEMAEEQAEDRDRVLYIEGDVLSTRLVERILHDREVISVMQGRLGLELARTHRPDLVVVDLHLPDVPGDAVVRLLREQQETAEVPVVVLSADPDPSLGGQLVADGATAYVTKPIDARRFRRTVEEALEGTRRAS